MDELKSCPFCGGEAKAMWFTAYGSICEWWAACESCEAKAPLPIWNTRYESTCTYEPEFIHTYFDENDNEVETNEMDDDGYLECSNCGFPMLREGWFEEEEGKHGGWIIKNRLFKYCPECGAKVVD